MIVLAKPANKTLTPLVPGRPAVYWAHFLFIVDCNLVSSEINFFYFRLMRIIIIAIVFVFIKFARSRHKGDEGDHYAPEDIRAICNRYEHGMTSEELYEALLCGLLAPDDLRCAATLRMFFIPRPRDGRTSRVIFKFYVGSLMLTEGGRDSAPGRFEKYDYTPVRGSINKVGGLTRFVAILRAANSEVGELLILNNLRGDDFADRARLSCGPAGDEVDIDLAVGFFLMKKRKFQFPQEMGGEAPVVEGPDSRRRESSEAL
jgi:hypothetical protein